MIQSLTLFYKNMTTRVTSQDSYNCDSGRSSLHRNPPIKLSKLQIPNKDTIQQAQVRVIRKLRGSPPSNFEWSSCKGSPDVEMSQTKKKIGSLDFDSTTYKEDIKQKHSTLPGTTQSTRWVLNKKDKNFAKHQSMNLTTKFMDRMRSTQHTIYKETVSTLFGQLTAIPKQRSQREIGLNRYDTKSPTQDERFKLSEFYRERVANVREGRLGDDYSKLEKDLQIDELKYLQATQYNNIHPILNKLLHQQRVQDTLKDTERHYYTAKQMEEIEKQNILKEQFLGKLVIEYRRKQGVEEICGDGFKDRAQIKKFIDRVLRIQSVILQEKQTQQLNNELRNNISSVKKRKRRLGVTNESYEYLAMKFFIKAGAHSRLTPFDRLKIRVEKVHRLKLSLAEVMQHMVFPLTPFQRRGSRQFFDALKQEDIVTVKAYLLQQSWFVYDFDHSLSTPLHIAAKRGQYQLVEILLDNKGDPNATDFLGKTPLFYALKNNHDQIALMLLAYGSDPWSDQRNRYRQFPLYHKKEIKHQFRKARQIDLMVAMSPANVKRKLRHELMKAMAFNF